jgi:hypothetical protein
MTMKIFARLQCRVHWLAVLSGLACAPAALAQAHLQPLPFSGLWLLETAPGAQPIYTRLTIKGTTLSWRGAGKSTPACEQAFVLQTERRGTVYRDGRGTQFIAGIAGSLPTYLLKLGAGSCSHAGEDVRISFPLVYDTDHIEFIEYVAGKPVSARRLRRRHGVTRRP